MYAKERQRLNMLKEPKSSNSQDRPVAAIVGTNVSENVTHDKTSSFQDTGSASQMQHKLDDFISSLSLAETNLDSNSSGNEALSGLLSASSLGPNAIPSLSQLNPVQLQQQQMLQMQVMFNQQMILQNMGALAAQGGLVVMPPGNYPLTEGVSRNLHQLDATISNPNTTGEEVSSRRHNPASGRGRGTATNLRPPPGGFQKTN